MAIIQKASRAWLQKYFDAPLPDARTLADALTFHVAEIEEPASPDSDLVEVNVLPDRAQYLLCHRGVASEVAGALRVPLARDPLAEPLPEWPATDQVRVTLGDGANRFIGALVTCVTVGPSPEWLRAALESVGQRSINNVVDATNFVMLDIGQPLHAFDAGKLAARDGGYAIEVRGSRAPEAITVLGGTTYELPEGTLLVTDANADGLPIGIAGIKGGEAAQVTDGTTTLLVEAANFDGARVRATAQRLKLFTDASSRFQNRPSPELVAYGMRDVLALILDIAGGELVGVTDVYPQRTAPAPVSVPLARLNAVLGTELGIVEASAALDRLSLPYAVTGDGASLTVVPPFWRTDLQVAEDLVEEIGRAVGYDRIAGAQLPPPGTAPSLDRFYGIERVRDFMLGRGYAEVSTPSFAPEGAIGLENPLQQDRPYLRASLAPNLADALARAALAAPRVLGPDRFAKVFEIGNAFTADGETLMLAAGVAALNGKPSEAAAALREDLDALEGELLGMPSMAQCTGDRTVAELCLEGVNLEKLGAGYAPEPRALGPYRPYSPYPSALRDVAVWTPAGTEESEVANAIVGAAGDLLARLDLFDRFEKGEGDDARISYAFRLVFESMERTLSDADLDPAMECVTAALNALPGWEVR